jgi:K+-sensing histidine kinase KdpD
MCAYPVEKCGADAILDVAGAHQCVIAIREGHWDILESPQLQRTKAELSRVNKELEKRVIESERYVESLTRNKRLRRQFVSALTHDVRNPLAAALMNAQLLARKLPGNFQVQSLTKRIVLALQRADGLIQDLLDLNKILSNAQIPFEIEEFDLYEVLDRLVKRIAPLQSRQIVLSSTRELIGHWDRRTLTQALDILISCSSSQADSGVPIFIEVHAGQSVSVDIHFKGTAPWISDSERWLLLSTHVEGIIRQHGGVFKADLMPTQEVRFHLEFPVRAGLSEISHAA